MNTASDPYSTALPITMSMSYSRYFSTAIPIAAHRHKNATFWCTFTATELTGTDAMNVATTSTAAAVNYFSCSRSSPADPANLTTTAATLTTSAAGSKMSVGSSTRGSPAWLAGLNGSGQMRAAFTSRSTSIRASAPPTNHAAGRHRRERSRPVGNSRNTNASMAIGIAQIQADSQAAARPAGQDPGSATRACSP